MNHIIWTISYGAYRMDHVIGSISHGLYNLDRFIFDFSVFELSQV